MSDYRDITVNFRMGEDLMDIPTMHKSNTEEYKNHLEPCLFFVDHHDILRATQGEYPIATTPEQIDMLIDYLQQVKSQMLAAQ